MGFKRRFDADLQMGIYRKGGALDDATRARLALAAIAQGPSEEDLANAPVLQFWEIQNSSLIGVVDMHPVLDEAARENADPLTAPLIQTSAVLHIDPEGRYARTISRWYALGRRFTPEECGIRHLEFSSDERLAALVARGLAFVQDLATSAVPALAAPVEVE